MPFGIFTYLITIFIFAGIAMLIEYIVCFRRLKKYIKVIGIILITGIIGTLIAESVALSWKIWVYSQNKTFGIYVFGAALETLIFTIFVGIAIASATLVWSDYEEQKSLSLKQLFGFKNPKVK